MPSRRLASILGINRYMLVNEWMHTWHQGPMQHLSDSCMSEARQYFSGTLEEKHDVLWSDIQRIYKEQGAKNRINTLTSTMCSKNKILIP
eukprot:5867011-Karenia_brevis.AAC.1